VNDIVIIAGLVVNAGERSSSAGVVAEIGEDCKAQLFSLLNIEELLRNILGLFICAGLGPSATLVWRIARLTRPT
jgi:hypothetical protein